MSCFRRPQGLRVGKNGGPTTEPAWLTKVQSTGFISASMNRPTWRRRGAGEPLISPVVLRDGVHGHLSAAASSARATPGSSVEIRSLERSGDSGRGDGSVRCRLLVR